jgi:hypothetical protein
MQELDQLNPERSGQVVSNELRAARRFVAVRDVSTRRAAGCEESIIVRVRDLSTRGIGLLSWRRFEKGNVLLLQLLEKYLAISPLIAAKVVQVTAQASGDWLIGCALARGLTEAEVQTLTNNGSAKK